jgi:hypothetical protein
MLRRHRRPFARRCGTPAALLAIVALFAMARVTPARADGDPASDVLVTENVFVPIELSISRQTNELQSLLAAAARAGFPIRVALIDSPKDLGTVTSLWRNPVAYSHYLGTELSLAFPHGQVAVVMPNGIGVYAGGLAPTAAERAVAAQLPAPGSGAALVTGAIGAVERLATAEGHPLSPAAAGRSTRPPAPGGAATETWLALGLGALLIALAWAASLRARPLQLRRRAPA